MPVSWSPAAVALVAALDLALSALPALVAPLDGARRANRLTGAGVDYNELARLCAVCAAINVVAGVVVAYARPRALCPCHALSVGDLLNEATNGVVGGVVVTLLIAGLANFGRYLVVGHSETMSLESFEEWPAPMVLPALCMRDRVSVHLSAILLLVSHTFLPLTVATKSSPRALRRVVVRLDVGGPLEATVLAGMSTAMCLLFLSVPVCLSVPSGFAN